MVLKKIGVTPFAHFASILTNAPVKKKPVILTFERGKINCIKKYKAKWID